MLSGIRGSEWLIILLVVIVVFGAQRLPKAARSLGAAAKEFRKGLEEGASQESTTPEDHS
jgi:sec-independent protein translocase protein TatA